MKNIRTYKRLYKEALKRKDYEFIDQVIMCEIWGIKSVCEAYKKYAKEMGYEDPLKADEQCGLSITWAHEVLFGNII